MLISIDGTPSFGSRAVRRVVVNLIDKLSELDKENSYKIFYIAFRYGLDKIPDFSKIPNIRKIVCRIPARTLFSLWKTIGFPTVYNFVGKVDIFHSTDHYIPPFPHCKYIQTIHGLHHLMVPNYLEKEFIETQTYYFNLIQKRAHFFIVESEHTKKEVCELLGFKEDRIKVIPLGVEPYFNVIDDREKLKKTLKEKFIIEKPYILYVGGVDPWKNILNIIDAFKILTEKKDFGHQLIMVGPSEKQRKHYFHQIKEKISDLKLEKDIKIIGYVTDNDLVNIYSAADVFIFPSLYEGWTSPPLEAMKCGCPVITSNVSSLPETVGDAAIKVNPYSSEEIADAVYNVLNDSELRNNLIKKGLEWSKQFTWEKMAREHLKFYEEVGRSI